MKRRTILIITAVLILISIWMHSIIAENSSYAESLWFTDSVINPIITYFGLAPVDKDLIRKAAHILEFFLFSLFTAILWKGKPVRNLYTGLTVALLDETIQVFTGRGGLVTDIWIDMIGVGIGTVIGVLVSGKKERDDSLTI